MNDMTITDITPRLPVGDLQRTISFYRQTLGFRIEVSWPDEHPSFVVLTRDKASVGFYLHNEHRTGAIGDAELYVEVDDAMAFHAALLGKVPIEWGPEVYSYGRLEFGIRDPDSYLLIFSELTNDAPTTDEP